MEMSVKRIENGFLLTMSTREAGRFRSRQHFFPTFAHVATFITNTGEAMIPARVEGNEDDDE